MALNGMRDSQEVAELGVSKARVRIAEFLVVRYPTDASCYNIKMKERSEGERLRNRDGSMKNAACTPKLT